MLFFPLLLFDAALDQGSAWTAIGAVPGGIKLSQDVIILSGCGPLQGTIAVQKVTLIPRGQARGLTWFIPGGGPNPYQQAADLCSHCGSPGRAGH